MAGRQAKATTIHKYQENFNLPLYHPLGKLCAARPQTSQSSFCSQPLQEAYWK